LKKEKEKDETSNMTRYKKYYVRNANNELSNIVISVYIKEKIKKQIEREHNPKNKNEKEMELKLFHIDSIRIKKVTKISDSTRK